MAQSSNIYTEPTSDQRFLGTYAIRPENISRDSHAIALDMKSDDDDWMGVMFCYQDRNNYYRFSWNGTAGGRRLIKCEDGVFSTLDRDTASYLSGQTYRVEIMLFPGSVTVLVDGSIMCTPLTPSREDLLRCTAGQTKGPISITSV